MIKIRNGKAYFKNALLPSSVDIISFDSIEDGATVYVAFKTHNGTCLVQRLDDDGNIIWSTEDKGIQVYDVKSHHDDYGYKIDLFIDAFGKPRVIVYAFTYVFIFSKETGALVQTEYNR